MRIKKGQYIRIGGENDCLFVAKVREDFTLWGSLRFRSIYWIRGWKVYILNKCPSGVIDT